MNFGDLMSIPEAARRARVPERTMRDRMVKLDRSIRETGGTAILVRFGGKGAPWKIRVDVLQAAVGATGDEPGDALDGILSRLDDLDTKMMAVRNGLRAERRRNEKRWDAQRQVNEGLASAVTGLGKLAGL